jgi:hypothetical protein
MATCPTTHTYYLTDLLHPAREATSTGVVDYSTRMKYWRHWDDYTTRLGIDLYLQDTLTQHKINSLHTFGTMVIHGDHVRRAQVGNQLFDQAWHAICHTCELAGLNYPTKAKCSSIRLFPLRRQIESYTRQDTAPAPQLDVHVTAVNSLKEDRLLHPLDVALEATADLCVIAFYFLLRVGECTLPTSNKKCRKVQLRIKDVTFC